MATIDVVDPNSALDAVGNIFPGQEYIIDDQYKQLFPMSVAAYKYDPTKYISYTGADADYYPEEGAFVVPEVHTASVSGHDLDALELSSGEKIVLTTNGGNKALEVSAIGIADPAVVDTTVLSAGANALKLHSDADTVLSANSINFQSGTVLDSSVTVANASDPTFRLRATETDMLVGTGVVDESGVVTSGAFLQTTADSFKLGHDSARITSDDAVDSTIRYEAAGKHEFFVGADAQSQATGSAAVEISADKVVIRKDVELTGTINSISAEQTSLQVQDQILHLAYSDDPATQKRDVLLSQSKTGLTIDTVPGDFATDADYMRGYKAADGTALFVDDGNSVIDVDKALASGAFSKEIAYHINGGVKSAGARTEVSRLNEPVWNVSGGALRLSHTVPAGDGLAKKFGLKFRITDGGDLEMVRITNNLQWNATDGMYEPNPGTPDTARVIARYASAAA